MIPIDGSYQRDTSGWEQIRFREQHGLQSAELNEMQAMSQQRLSSVANAIFADGNVISGCECIIDAETGTVQLTAGKLYLLGCVRDVPAAELEISLAGEVSVGVVYRETAATERDDPTLRNPAPDTRGYGEPGAARVMSSLQWAVGGDDEHYYGVYTVVDGVLRDRAQGTEFDGIKTALARYDREANGSYVVNGLALTYITETDGDQVYSLAEGKAHVDGYEVELPVSLRLTYPVAQDLQAVESEPSLFQPDANGQMRITLNHAPAVSIQKVEITEEKTLTLTHGGYSGIADPLPDSAVLEVLAVTQGTVNYQAGTDYTLNAARIDWSALGAEPAPGSSYDVTYRHIRSIDPISQDATGLVVAGAVPGTLVLVDYEWALPRIDILTIDQQGEVRKIDGIPHGWRPPVPVPPSGQLQLATIYQNWLAAPTVQNDAVQVVAMNRLQTMQQQIADLYDLMAIERLKTDAVASDPAAKRGIFVDPFLDDDMRDQGLEQTAAIVGGELTLAIDAVVYDLANVPRLLDYTLEPVLEQLAQTGMMRVNPYQAFEILPAHVQLTPEVDRWVEQRVEWLSPVSTQLTVGSGNLSTSNSQTTTETVNTRSSAIRFLRQREVAFTVAGFGPGEALASLTFDGITVEARA